MGALTSRYHSRGAHLRRCLWWKEKTETETMFLVGGDILSGARAQIKEYEEKGM